MGWYIRRSAQTQRTLSVPRALFLLASFGLVSCGDKPDTDSPPEGDTDTDTDTDSDADGLVNDTKGSARGAFTGRPYRFPISSISSSKVRSQSSNTLWTPGSLSSSRKESQMNSSPASSSAGSSSNCAEPMVGWKSAWQS